MTIANAGSQIKLDGAFSSIILAPRPHLPISTATFYLTSYLTSSYLTSTALSAGGDTAPIRRRISC